MVQYNMAMTYSSGVLTFLYIDRNGHVVSYLAKYDGTAGTWRFGAARFFDNKSRVTSYGLYSNGGPNVQYSTNDILFHHKLGNNRHEIDHHWTAPLRPPVNVTPASGATLLSSTPVVRASADLDIQFPQSLVKMRWEFARDAAFTTSFVSYTQKDAALKLVENTHLEGSTVPFSDVLPGDFELSQGIWFVRAAHVDEYGVIGQFTQVQLVYDQPPAGGWSVDPQWLVTDLCSQRSGGLGVHRPFGYRLAHRLQGCRDSTRHGCCCSRLRQAGKCC